MSTHETWTGNDGTSTYSWRSDQTLWQYTALAGWTQVTNTTTQTAVMWFALQECSAGIAACKGAVTAAGESGGPPPPPPPQV